MSRNKTSAGIELVSSSSQGAPISSRIKDLRKLLGWNQTKLAEACDVTQAQVSRWEKGLDKPSAGALYAISRLAPDGEQEYWKDSMGVAFAVKALDSDLREVPVLVDAAAAGTPRAIDERQVDYTMALPRRLLRSGGNVQAVPVEGDSMSPILENGYLAFIDVAVREPAKLVGKMVAARDGTGVTLKWLRKQSKLYLLVPQHTSPRHQVQVMQDEGEWSIVGEVIGWFGTPPPERK